MIRYDLVDTDDGEVVFSIWAPDVGWADLRVTGPRADRMKWRQATALSYALSSCPTQ